ncbi:hypothetical protein ASPWEDRAFT_173159 [Aspergillus wentii DTO 134E9]|uniref:4-hydroxyphenylpyruvate dioxygenase n=1 Tax=Aspergillus wentii DTO 134E9 TaxID=1073089 RepID=A0A1L9RFM1_ASPWE|nr:uncharacterized protein ASPWEDRAFT_173159 [Aspergillus wentii DTO 134E9]KAI9925486.1 hypothetical protein MW887_005867 [Aspergillus wentii]OJJ33722.1 hypothetical protein ASPWEDRAFT_173159 [Aspergillus wentii DTO 134E9]
MGDARAPQRPVSTINPNYLGFDYIGWYVGNARQAVSYFVNHYGFEVLAYRGPETGSYVTTAYVVGNGAARFLFTAPLCSPNNASDKRATPDEHQLCEEIHTHVASHGDGVKDIAFRVDDVHGVWEHAVQNGAESVREPTVLKDDGGEVQIAAIRTFGDTIHTLINRSGYSRPFLPGFKSVEGGENRPAYLPKVEIVEIDHCVGNQPWDGLDGIVDYYQNTLNFHRYWSVDDKDMCSDYSAMRSVVVASPNEVIKMPMNEPAQGKKKFVDYYNGAGCQHIAFRTNNIIDAVESLRQRGVAFLSVPENYYTDVRKRLEHMGTQIREDIDKLQQYNILIDFDEGGYLLQVFTKHVGDRPTVFLEIIQRENFDGFGAGNFKSLFEAFEREQVLRGNL